MDTFTVNKMHAFETVPNIVHVFTLKSSVLLTLKIQTFLLPELIY